MIITEFYRTREDGAKLYRTFSDRGMKIEDENGHVFDEAVEHEDYMHTYTETNEPIEPDLSDSQALNIIMGRDANYGLPNGINVPSAD